MTLQSMLVLVAQRIHTSQCIMLSNTVGIITKRFYIASIEDVPEKLRFDANTASAGDLKARELFALANDVPIESVHHLPAFMVTNQDDMAVMYDGKSQNHSEKRVL